MISASSLLRVARCPGSEALPHANVSTTWTESGTERHGALEADILARGTAALPERLRVLLPDGAALLVEQALAYDTATGKARQLVVDGRAYETTPTEIPMRTDLIIRTRSKVYICDWKGHRSVGKPSTNMQLLVNGLAVAHLFGVDEVTLVVAYIGDGVEDAPCSIETVDELDLDAFAARLPGVLAAVEEQRKRDVPDVTQGEWCGHCPARQHCPATQALARYITDPSTARNWRMMLPLDAERAADLYERIQLAKSVLSDLSDAVAACTLAEPDQRIKLPSGKWYGKRVSTRESVDGATARGVLMRLIGEHADKALTYETSKKAIDAAVSDYAKEHGLKAAALKREVYEDIRKAGGIESKVSERLTEFADKAEGEAA